MSTDSRNQRFSIHCFCYCDLSFGTGAPALHYVMGGGWELCTQSVIGKRIRDDRTRRGQLVTLPDIKLV